MHQALLDAEFKANTAKMFREEMAEGSQKTFEQKVMAARVHFAFRCKKVKNGLLNSLLLAWMSIKEGGQILKVIMKKYSPQMAVFLIWIGISWAALQLNLNILHPSTFFPSSFPSSQA
ncbi:hypothetical protein DACRYDRAFT_111341 [Dacryopinax primogenitus]|uniref:Uncharacterized protein n=1 Tax=Dacryopinax primogenitus (strain DJM 731) TaxID=1858805 RepID=M5FQL5_DACPD|nr:uncharacterized protein DACRYDRAFT_111341 [Dacryopinax primogenitus]EJT97823.1 hypothetical protein DACRYDRAFT_111341 [Dacryopinax primogenitus]